MQSFHSFLVTYRTSKVRVHPSRIFVIVERAQESILLNLKTHCINKSSGRFTQPDLFIQYFFQPVNNSIDKKRGGVKFTHSLVAIFINLTHKPPMKKTLLTLTLLLALTTPALASNTTGYAWSESVGYFDFSNATLSDTTLTGFAYNDNTGWLNLDGVTNTNGTLTGYAWSESLGFFDFSHVYLDNGTLKGYAYNDNTGYLIFNVTTTYTPATPEVHHSSGGGSSRPKATPPVVVPTTLPATLPELQALLVQLQAQLAQLMNTSSSSYTYTRDLQMNSDGADVQALQIFLNTHGFPVNAGLLPGAPGHESTYFGNRTHDALAAFQKAQNIAPAVGYFGPLTKQLINSLN